MRKIGRSVLRSKPAKPPKVELKKVKVTTKHGLKLGPFTYEKTTESVPQKPKSHKRSSTVGVLD